MIRIVSDSTCDLSPELIKRYSIEIVPLCIELGDREYLDGVNITPDEIYVWSDANKTTPRTAAVSYDTVEKLLRRYVESGDEVICFSISDTMSTTGNVFRMAAAELKADQKIHVFNSENLSTGIGNLEGLNFTKAFMGTNGIDLTAGFTTPDIDEARIKSTAVRQSYMTFVLADHTKFRKVCAATFAPLKIGCIITDACPDNKYSEKTIVKEVTK